MVEVSLVRFVTVRRASQLTGYSEDAIRCKINTGIWRENEVWKWGPDGVQLVDLEGYDKWESQPGRPSKRGKRVLVLSRTEDKN